MARIYTRAGDSGETGLFDGTRVRKHDARVAALGDVDELNAGLGVAVAALPAAAADLAVPLEAMQRDLFALGALLADPARATGTAAPADPRLELGPAHVERLERQVDAWEEELAPLRVFILPGGHPAAAALHAARTVARRAERAVVALADRGTPTGVAVTYLNRVSDTLFVAARLVNQRSGRPDVAW